MNAIRLRQLSVVCLYLAGILIVAGSGRAWEATRLEITEQGPVIHVDHQFVADLPADSVARLLYLPHHLMAAEAKGPGVLEIAAEGTSGYDLLARFSLLWIYRNRIVLHRSIERRGDTLFVRSKLVKFWQTVGFSPEPSNSIAVYTIVPKPYGGTKVSYTQRTVFQEPLGAFAYRRFSSETTRSLMDVVAYIRRFEPAQVAKR